MRRPLSLGRLHWLLAAVLLLSALTLGGGQGTLGDSLCQLLAIFSIALSLVRHRIEPDARLPSLAWLAALPLLLPALQLLPFAEFLWQMAPIRVELEGQLAQAGVEPALRVSLVPLATERALLWLLPASALFLAGLQMSFRQRVVLLALFVAVALASVLLGLAQLAGGVDSPLRLYSVTNTTEAVGFFANRNHFASLLAMALPFVLVGTAAWVGTKRESGRAPMIVGALFGIGMAGLLILGIAIAGSRAGLGLGTLAALLSVVAVVTSGVGRGARRTIGAAAVVGLLLSVQFALFGVLELAKVDPMDDSRFDYAPLALAAAAEHAPTGSGLGAFRRAFEPHDTPPRVVYLNHVHNDYVEAWFEGRWMALVIGAVLLLAFVAAAWKTWRPRGRTALFDRMLARATFIGLSVPVLHSLVDYPLRTTSVLAVTGLLASILAASRSARQDS